MWRLTTAKNAECISVRDQLERISESADHSRLAARGTLLAGMPSEVRNHLRSCEDCRVFADEILEVRAMLQGMSLGPQPGPFFMNRVMAAIVERENELEQNSQTWAAVPRLAYRFSVLASLILLIAGSWLYQWPRHPVSVAGLSSPQTSEGLVEGGSSPQDDLLVSGADR